MPLQYKIENHMVTPARVKDLRLDVAIDIHPRALIMHATAGSTVQGALTSMSQSPNPFAHLLIGRDGVVYQIQKLNRMAWHAGPSQYTQPDGVTLSSFNRFSIGIELDNPGFLTRMNGSNDWVAWFGRAYQNNVAVPMRHPKFPYKDWGWLPYTAVQLEAAALVGRAIVDHYDIELILGHEDINAEKSDPGPMFPMKRFQEFVRYGGQWRHEP